MGSQHGDRREQVGLLQHPSGGSGVGTCDCRVDRVGRVQTVSIFRVLQCDDEACIPLRWSWYLEPPRARRSWLRGACDRQGSGGRWPSPPFVGELRMRRVPLPVGITPVCASESKALQEKATATLEARQLLVKWVRQNYVRAALAFVAGVYS